MIAEFRESRGGFGGGRDRGSSRGFGGGSRGGFGGGRDRPQRREMFDVTCTKCGKDCQVPFKPTGSKPVLCSDCFSESGSSRSSGSDSGSLSQINAKLDKILQVLQDLELVMDDEGSEDQEEAVEESNEDIPTDAELADADSVADDEEN